MIAFTLHQFKVLQLNWNTSFYHTWQNDFPAICVGAFWESSTMRLIRLLYYDCRWVVKCSVLSVNRRSIVSELVQAHSLSISHCSSPSSIVKRLFSWERLSWQSVHFVLLGTLLFFPVSLIVSGFFHPLYRSISLLLFILSKIRKVSLECVIFLTLSHSFSFSVVLKAWKVNSRPLEGNRLHTDSLCKTQIHILCLDGVRILMDFYLWSVLLSLNYFICLLFKSFYLPCLAYTDLVAELDTPDSGSHRAGVTVAGVLLTQNKSISIGSKALQVT